MIQQLETFTKVTRGRLLGTDPRPLPIRVHLRSFAAEFLFPRLTEWATPVRQCGPSAAGPGQGTQPMLQICRSNRVETLLDLLAHRLGEAPLASPFTPEMVVAPSPAMARWVHLGLAGAHGVAANLVYPLPASFVWHLARDLLGDSPEVDPLGLEPMAWRIYAALPALLPDPAFAPLRHYLEPVADAVKRWQLAERIADAFDRYQLYRPDLIRAWCEPNSSAGAGDADAWQPLLWRDLTAGIDAHRVTVIDRLLARLTGPGPCPGLPERVSLFAVSSLPPLLVEVVQALAGHTRVDLYLHAPTDQFWADLVDQKAQARRRLEHPEDAELWEVGNPLLASWGRQGQALQDLLLSREVPALDVETWVPPVPDSLLHRIQGDIYSLRGPDPEGSRETVAPDGSLQVQACHSPLRECQVLHDRLLGWFEAEPDLRPEDCLVMVPEIDAYAPYIEAVFEGDPGAARPHIPWNLSDLSLRDQHPLIQVFLQILDLPHSRFGQAEVLSYLDVPELAATFGLDPDAVARIKGWLAQARLRWGLDGDHKARLGLPEVTENTWAQAGRRLFGGYALAGAADAELDCNPSFADISPIAGVEGTAAEALGRFWRLLDLLQETAVALPRPRPAGHWQIDLGRLLDDLFGAGGDEDGRIQRIRDALAELAEQGAQPGAQPATQPGADPGEALPLALVRHWLTERLGRDDRRGRYFRGGVTFCGMRPMRSLPFQVVCILGLNDGVFPRPDRPLEFDLMRRAWRPGDPRKGDEDRYLFLETLLCARRRLYLSYLGRDPQANAERQPSVLLRELLDAIDLRFAPPPTADGSGPKPLSAQLTRVAPLQPFSPRAFRPGDPDQGFDGGWCDLARAALASSQGVAAQGVRAPAIWPTEPLPPAPEALRQVGLRSLEGWLRQAQRALVRTRLGIYLAEEAVEADDEPFALDGLAGFDLKQRLIAGRLRALPRGGGPDDGIPGVRALAARGDLPHGAFAGLTQAEALDQVRPLLDRIDAYRGLEPGRIELDLAFDPVAELGRPDGPTRLFGQVPDLYPGLGLLRVRPSKLKGDQVLTLWLHLLAWCAAIPGEGPRAGCLIASDQTLSMALDLDPETARGELARVLAWYWEGLHRPLPLFPKASFAYAQVWAKDKNKDPAGVVRAAWVGNDFQGIPGEREDPNIRLILNGAELDPMDIPEFAPLAQDLYGPALAAAAP